MFGSIKKGTGNREQGTGNREQGIKGIEFFIPEYHSQRNLHLEELG
jgi:hypothetical protein